MSALRWSRRTTEKTASLLAACGIAVSANTVARLLHEMNFSLRVNHKELATSCSTDRNLQFDYIADLRERFQRRRMPIISVDTKKREMVGNFKNSGTRWDRSARLVNDHDFLSDALGVAIPYGIYQPVDNRGSVIVGVSHDTSAFAAHAIAHWWQCEGLPQYSHSRQLLILADSGGSNSCRRRAWKTELQAQLADRFHLNITVAHYPTGASKWNPIEHRLFSEISKHWAGEPLDSYQTILRLIGQTKTQTGLRVKSYLISKHFETGKKISAEQMSQLLLVKHKVLPEWNYTLYPRQNPN